MGLKAIYFPRLEIKAFALESHESPLGGEGETTCEGRRLLLLEGQIPQQHTLVLKEASSATPQLRTIWLLLLL